MSLRLHPQHGVNPTLGVCFWCGADDGTVVLLGHNRGKEAARRTCVSLEPCDACKGRMALGITFIECTRHPEGDNVPRLSEGAYPTGRWMVVKPEAVERLLTGEQVIAAVLRHRKAYVEPEAFSAVLRRYTEAHGQPPGLEG